MKLCTALLYASGYRPDRQQAHFRTLQALPLILGANRKADAEYLDACRIKRNTVEYDHAGGATDKDAKELLAFAWELREATILWIKERRPDLLEE